METNLIINSAVPCLMSYMHSTGSLGMRLLVLTAPHHKGVLVRDKDLPVQPHSEDPAQLNKYFWRQTVHWKRAVKPSLGDKFILAPRTPARLGGAAWAPWRAVCPPCSASQWETSARGGIWDALWCPSYDPLSVLAPTKEAAAPRCLLSPTDLEEAVHVSGSGLLWHSSLFKQMLTHHGGIKNPLDIATLHSRPHYSGRVAINWFPQILLNSEKTQIDGKDKADLNNYVLK